MSESIDSDAKQKAAGMKCPVDQLDLVMSERQGIEIDYCPRCRGVWLDRGELDKIIERSAAETPQRVAGAPAQQAVYRDNDDDHHGGRGGGYGRGGRRRSWLGEIFD